MPVSMWYQTSHQVSVEIRQRYSFFLLRFLTYTTFAGMILSFFTTSTRTESRYFDLPLRCFLYHSYYVIADFFYSMKSTGWCKPTVKKNIFCRYSCGFRSFQKLQHCNRTFFHGKLTTFITNSSLIYGVSFIDTVLLVFRGQQCGALGSGSAPCKGLK